MFDISKLKEAIMNNIAEQSINKMCLDLDLKKFIENKVNDYKNRIGLQFDIIFNDPFIENNE